MSSNDGRFLLRLARKAIEVHLKEKRRLQRTEVKTLAQDSNAMQLGKHGAFVTLKTISGRLRGCTGYPLAVKEVEDAVAECAVASATRDSRFPPVSLKELKNLKVEVSVLTPACEVKAEHAKDFAKKIKAGRDGLIIEYEGFSGLLLPQVAPEQGWDEREFLCGLCEKAGLPFDCWLKEKNGKPVVKISSFQARVFSE
ncbi:TPA: TIGR00296 family protein [Candidatus Micrarchaeota archaeon]|nr:TIGR00296 family protein [Candidatus Micrarchaeota archaeon]